MREIVFRVVQEPGGILRARSLQPPLQIRAASLDDLHHEAREALIDHYGSAHSTVRVRLQHPVWHQVCLASWPAMAFQP